MADIANTNDGECRSKPTAPGGRPFGRRARIIVGFGAAAFLTALLSWIFIRSAGTQQQPIDLCYLGSRVFTGAGVTFAVTNHSSSGVCFYEKLIEVKQPTGWTAYNSAGPIAPLPMLLAPGTRGYLNVTPPNTNLPWRIRVAVESQLKGPIAVLERISLFWTHIKYRVLTSNNNRPAPPRLWSVNV